MTVCPSRLMLVTVWGGAGSVTMLLAVITPSGWVGTGPRTVPADAAT